MATPPGGQRVLAFASSAPAKRGQKPKSSTDSGSPTDFPPISSMSKSCMTRAARQQAAGASALLAACIRPRSWKQQWRQRSLSSSFVASHDFVDVAGGVREQSIARSSAGTCQIATLPQASLSSPLAQQSSLPGAAAQRLGVSGVFAVCRRVQQAVARGGGDTTACNAAAARASGAAGAAGFKLASELRSRARSRAATLRSRRRRAARSVSSTAAGRAGSRRPAGAARLQACPPTCSAASTA